MTATPTARRIAYAIGLAALAIAGTIVTVRSMDDDRAGTTARANVAAGLVYVGADLHSLAVSDRGIYIGGHQAVGASHDAGRSWQRLGSLANADAMGWAFTTDAVLVGGHNGLRWSADGQTFALTPTPAADVHALGASGRTVYLASPAAGVFRSTDDSQTWHLVNPQTGRSFSGTLIVDPGDHAHVYAADQAAGAMETHDGGRTWRSLGAFPGTTSIGWNHTAPELLVVAGAGGGAISHDAGRNWTGLDLPGGTAVVAVGSAPTHPLFAATWTKGWAQLYRSTDQGQSWQPIHSAAAPAVS